MASSFEQLGARIEAGWFEANYRESSFSDICVRALEEMSPPNTMGADAILAWAFARRRLPRQVDIDSDFGEPALTVFDGERFHISVYFWMDGTTDIHEHCFSGAFQVLEGASLHTTFSFEPKETWSDHLLLGEVDPVVWTTRGTS